MRQQGILLTFGTTHCLIEVTTHHEVLRPDQTSFARPYVMDRRGVLPLNHDDEGPVEFTAGSEDMAIDRACQYLQWRFGAVAPPSPGGLFFADSIGQA